MVEIGRSTIENWMNNLKLDGPCALAVTEAYVAGLEAAGYASLFGPLAAAGAFAVAAGITYAANGDPCNFFDMAQPGSRGNTGGAVPIGMDLGFSSSF